MSWRDDLTTVRHRDGRELIGATFRGVPFFVPTSERAGGRRLVVHEFPLRDDPHVEDLGRRARVYVVEGYVLGADYVRHRDALISALEDIADPGELVHPYYGVRRAICAEMSVRESANDGGIATFAITFHDAPERATVPVQQIDLAAQVEAASVAAVAATRAEFVAAFDVAALPAFALESAAAALATASAALYVATGPFARTTQALARLNADTTILNAQAMALLQSPGQTFDQFAGALSALADSLTEIPRAFLAALWDAYSRGAGPPVLEGTPTRVRERKNQVALASALQCAIAIQGARELPSMVFATIDEARDARAEVLERLDEQIAIAGTLSYPALQDLRAAVVDAIPGDNTYARLITVERNTATPSLALTYQIYGSVDQEADLVARNATVHPGFMGGEIKALSNV